MSVCHLPRFPQAPDLSVSWRSAQFFFRKAPPDFLFSSPRGSLGLFNCDQPPTAFPRTFTAVREIPWSRFPVTAHRVRTALMLQLPVPYLSGCDQFHSDAPYLKLPRIEEISRGLDFAPVSFPHVLRDPPRGRCRRIRAGHREATGQVVPGSHPPSPGDKSSRRVHFLSGTFQREASFGKKQHIIPGRTLQQNLAADARAAGDRGDVLAFALGGSERIRFENPFPRQPGADVPRAEGARSPASGGIVLFRRFGTLSLGIRQGTSPGPDARISGQVPLDPPSPRIPNL